MFEARSQAFVSALCTLALAAARTAPAQDRPMRKDQAGLPAGSEKAVKAALAADVGAVLDEVVTPSQSIGLGGTDGTFWTIHTRVDGTRRTINVSADGVPIRGSKVVESKDLPTTAANGLAKVAPNGAAKITKLETLGVVRFVPLATPVIRYRACVSSDAGTVTLTVAPDGAVLDTRKAKEARQAPAVDKNARTQDGPIPEYAAKAVKAMREVFPDMVFDLVEEVPYVDSSTQTISMLWYEVEFFLGGVKHEFNATPDGTVIAYTKAIPAADLPEPVASAVAKAAADGKIEEVVMSETRAGPRFVALDLPVVVYEIQPRGAADAPARAIKLRADGTEVREPEWPEWVKKSTRKSGTAHR